MRRFAESVLRSGDARRFGLGLVWSTLGMAAVRLTPLITTVIISRTLGIEIVGEFAIAYGTLMSAGMLAASGLSIMAVRNIAANVDRDKELTGRIVGMALILVGICSVALAALFYALSDVIARSVLAQPEVAPSLALVAPIVVLNALSQVQQAVLGGLQRFAAIARLNLFFGLALICLVPLGLLRYGLVGCFVAMGAATLCLCIGSFPTMRRALAENGVSIRFRGALSEWPLITRYALPALIASIVFEPVQWICVAILAGASGGLTAVGIYYIAMQLETLLVFVPQIVVNVVTPMLSSAFGAGDRRRLAGILMMSVGTTSAIAVGFVGFMLLFGDLVLRVFSLDVGVHWPVFVFAVANAAVMAFAAPLGAVPSTSGYTWSGLAITAGWALTFIGGTWLLRDQGAEGATAARLIAWSAQTVVYVLFTRWLLTRPALATQPAE